MEYLRHITVRKEGKFYHATCLRCGLRASAEREGLLKRVLQNHLCKGASQAAPPPREKSRP